MRLSQLTIFTMSLGALSPLIVFCYNKVAVGGGLGNGLDHLELRQLEMK